MSLRYARRLELTLSRFFITGFAMAIMLALGNVFLANMAGSTVILGLSQGAYGIGGRHTRSNGVHPARAHYCLGIIGPIAASVLASHGILFARFYAILISVRLISLAVAGWSFHDFEREMSQEQESFKMGEHTGGEQRPSEAATNGANRLQGLKLAIRNRVTISGALFIFAYQGAEVSISGWVISFLLNYRSGTPAKVGYVTTYFWVCHACTPTLHYSVMHFHYSSE